METTMNQDMNRTDNESILANIAFLSRNMLTPRLGTDVVRWTDFRLGLGISGFTLVFMLAGFTWLYTAIADLRTDIIESRGNVDILGIEIKAETGALRNEIVNVRERVTQIETHLETADVVSDAPDG